MAFTKCDLGDKLPLLASGKVRELYKVDLKTLLFVASDRISAYDVIMENVSLNDVRSKRQLTNHSLRLTGHPREGKGSYDDHSTLVRYSTAKDPRTQDTFRVT